MSARFGLSRNGSGSRLEGESCGDEICTPPAPQRCFGRAAALERGRDAGRGEPSRPAASGRRGGGAAASAATRAAHLALAPAPSRARGGRPRRMVADQPRRRQGATRPERRGGAEGGRGAAGARGHRDQRFRAHRAGRDEAELRRRRDRLRPAAGRRGAGGARLERDPVGLGRRDGRRSRRGRKTRSGGGQRSSWQGPAGRNH